MDICKNGRNQIINGEWNHVRAWMDLMFSSRSFINSSISNPFSSLSLSLTLSLSKILSLLFSKLCLGRDTNVSSPKFFRRTWFPSRIHLRSWTSAGESPGQFPANPIRHLKLLQMLLPLPPPPLPYFSGPRILPVRKAPAPATSLSSRKRRRLLDLNSLFLV